MPRSTPHSTPHNTPHSAPHSTPHRRTGQREWRCGGAPRTVQPHSTPEAGRCCGPGPRSAFLLPWCAAPHGCWKRLHTLIYLAGAGRDQKTPTQLTWRRLQLPAQLGRPLLSETAPHPHLPGRRRSGGTKGSSGNRLPRLASLKHTRRRCFQRECSRWLPTFVTLEIGNIIHRPPVKAFIGSHTPCGAPNAHEGGGSGYRFGALATAREGGGNQSWGRWARSTAWLVCGTLQVPACSPFLMQVVGVGVELQRQRRCDTSFPGGKACNPQPPYHEPLQKAP
eukprot:335739-Chlamydomonas_euryale.AAC.1